VHSHPRHPWHRRARSALRRSLRLRLILVFWLLALGMAVIFILGTQRALGQGWRQAVAPLLGDYVDRLAAEVGSPPDVLRAKALAERLPISVRIDGPQVRWASAPDAWGGEASDDGDEASWNRAQGTRLLERRTADGHVVSFGLGATPWRGQPRVIGGMTLLGLLAMTAVAYSYVRRLLRPLDDIREGARRFGAGGFDEPIAVRHNDELGDLARQINAMAHDLHQMLEGKRALLLAISHELRSPLTRARLNAELLPEQGEANSTREALLRDLAEMRDLITDLLEGERLSVGHGALHREQVSLKVLIDELLASRPDFAAVRAQVPADLPPMSLDPARVRLALRNLLDNAIRHGGPGVAAPTLSVSAGPGRVTLQVRDFGPGVEADQIARLAQAFYRPDSARQRSTGGVGLGLYLCRLVAQAHGGRLELSAAEPGLSAALQLALP
jgi:signal transduction histidine kinase